MSHRTRADFDQNSTAYTGRKSTLKDPGGLAAGYAMPLPVKVLIAIMIVAVLYVGATAMNIV